MTLTVQLFAASRELAGQPGVTLDIPDACTIDQLRVILGERYPALNALLSRSAIARNHHYARDSDVIEPGDELALIPPVSGG